MTMYEYPILLWFLVRDGITCAEKAVLAAAAI